ncbi:MAG: cell division protein FtsB [Duodenibacillus sp.]|nr:cell division protein FtsB [Duodenibacillus sp.]
MRVCIYLGLIAAAAAVQYPLWMGKGGLLRMQELRAEIAAMEESNERLAQRNQALEAEIESLESGSSAVEERARLALGMVRGDEVLFRLVQIGEKQAALQSLQRAAPMGGGRVFVPKRKEPYNIRLRKKRADPKPGAKKSR